MVVILSRNKITILVTE